MQLLCQPVPLTDKFARRCLGISNLATAEQCWPSKYLAVSLLDPSDGGQKVTLYYVPIVWIFSLQDSDCCTGVLDVDLCVMATKKRFASYQGTPSYVLNFLAYGLTGFDPQQHDIRDGEYESNALDVPYLNPLWYLFFMRVWCKLTCFNEYLWSGGLNDHFRTKSKFNCISVCMYSAIQCFITVFTNICVSRCNQGTASEGLLWQKTHYPQDPRLLGLAYLPYLPTRMEHPRKHSQVRVSYIALCSDM